MDVASLYTTHDRGLYFEGVITSMRGAKITAKMPLIPMGALCTIHSRPPCRAVVTAFNEDEVFLLPLTTGSDVSPGTKVTSFGTAPSLHLSPSSPWGIYDFQGIPLNQDEEHSRSKTIQLPLEMAAPPSLQRRKLTEQCVTGIRSIDALLPIAYGQRVALLAQPGVGKSTLLGALTKNAEVDCTIIGLIGERGREVNEFIEDALGSVEAHSTMMFVATSDALPMARWLTALAATRAAEYFRAQGKRVLLCIDSLTRCARAIREFSLILGELPVRHGFTPSVYELLPRLLERSGADERGTITAFYTLLSEENGEDPLSAEIMSLLDGHFFLSKQLAQRTIFPAIDPGRSISRLSNRLTDEQHKKSIASFVRHWTRLERDRDLIQLGGAVDPELLESSRIEPQLISFLKQPLNERVQLLSSRQQLQLLCQ